MTTSRSTTARRPHRPQRPGRLPGPPRRPGPERPCLVGRTAAVVALAVLAASGCVSVNGEDAVVPSVSRSGAEAVLKEFTATSNRANKELDLELNARIETGVLGDIDEGTLRVRRDADPGGLADYKPLRLTDTRYLVPELAGWPKWFVADTANNRDRNRWLLAFTRDGADEDWKASYLTVVEPDLLPDLVLGEDGHAEAVPLDGTGLAVAPGKLSAEYADYLQDGRSALFARGPHTDRLRKAREKEKRTPRYVTQYADRAAPGEGYEPFALRTADGGALVLFATRHTWKVTAATGVPLPEPGAYTTALMSGTPKRSITRTAVAEQTAVVGVGADGTVDIVNRIQSVVSARGE